MSSLSGHPQRYLALVSEESAGAPWGDVEVFADALRARDEAATSAFYRRFAPYVRTLLLRILGPSPDIADLVHDVFVQALESIGSFREAAALRSWLRATAVFIARGYLRRKRRRRWLSFLPTEKLPETGVQRDAETDETVRATYTVLEKLPDDERIAFTLRVVEGLELTEVASACAVSLATVKRRLARADERFGKLCAQHPALRGLVLAEGGAP